MQLEHGAELVQRERQPYRHGKPATPIFLIHDGGGTTFAYHCMNSINRFVYGIGNPYFTCPESFDGDLADLGELYVSWIQTAVSTPDFPIRRANDGRIQIYLGGWSLGGMLSLEVANRLDDDDHIKVIGLLMVDTVYPGDLGWTAEADLSNEIPETGLTKNQVLSRKCMAHARRMVRKWKMPVWDGDAADTRPKCVLLRAKQYQPTAADSTWFHELDVYREDETFGWGKYDKDMFTQVFPVDGHHFDLFSLERVGETTKVIKRALETLDAAQEVVVNEYDW
ncbi:Thioesterase domain containing protein [Metarhizium rileyi]|uniref:Thioesterase domain containing protein n=1 Tax=Metarhizium rileyi (strain RCEF 4871) TaxID=1649241 RepID=A0A162I3S6_METRR|nr:Thioesterase domain containing protein [Metarhizium rileyi RCEF 4871]